MMLTTRELEKLTIFTAAELSRKRKNRGLKLNPVDGKVHQITRSRK